MSGLVIDPDYMAKRDRGLLPQSRVSATEPRVQSHSKQVDLPQQMRMSDDYGTPQELVAYLRTVNGVPVEAEEEHSTDGMGGYSVRWTWWTIDNLWEQKGR